MIEGILDPKTLAKMNVALDRVCETAPRGEQHPVRKRIAREIIKCARSGRTTLSELTSAGERALRNCRPAGSGLAQHPEARAEIRVSKYRQAAGTRVLIAAILRLSAVCRGSGIEQRGLRRSRRPNGQARGRRRRSVGEPVDDRVPVREPLAVGGRHIP